MSPGTRPMSRHDDAMSSGNSEQAKAPFGGSLWQRGAEPDGAPLDLDEDDESGEAPRRRRNTPEPSPYPRKTVAALGEGEIVRDAAVCRTSLRRRA
jgi:hypothetical protein